MEIAKPFNYKVEANVVEDGLFDPRVYLSVIDILNTIMWLNFAKITLALMKECDLWVWKEGY